MKQIKLTIQYDGTEYAGWQVQPKERTIQGTIESFIKNLAPDHSSLIAAGRTDAGVHAIEQVACFKTSSHHEPGVFRKALNAQLPPDIRILDAEECNPSFHPRYDAKSKTYVYLIHQGETVSPFLYRYVWNVRYTLNVTAMKEAAHHLTGKHDFTSLQASGCAAKNPVREISFLDIRRMRSLRFLHFSLRGNFILFTVEANAFLRHMVRNIVGTLVDVGRGAMEAEEIKRVLSAKDRTLSGPTAPPGGLFLQKIAY
ncbi:MAG: tRNA pseudouridine(38-40) synthase TruA [bacterium]